VGLGGLGGLAQPAPVVVVVVLAVAQGEQHLGRPPERVGLMVVVLGRFKKTVAIVVIRALPVVAQSA